MPRIVPVDASVRPNFDYDRIGLPENVAVTMHLSPHLTENDLPPPTVLDGIFKSADIVIPEFVHSEFTKNDMARIAMGRPKDYLKFREMIKGNAAERWLLAFASTLYSSRVATANIDIHLSHPSIKQFMSASDQMFVVGGNHVRRNFDRVHELAVAMYAAQMQRDQLILENVQPEIEALTKSNRKLASIRERRPLDTHIFYGSLHRAVLDGLIAKNELEPTEGFSATDSNDSLPIEVGISGYAKYIRGQEVMVEDLERVFAYSALGNYIKRRNYLGNAISTKALTAIFLRVEDELDPTDLATIPAQFDAILENGTHFEVTDTIA